VAPLRRLGLASALAIAASAALTDAPLALLVPVLLVAGVLTMSWNGLAFTATAELSGRDRAGTAIGLQQTVMRALSSGAGVGFGAFVAATTWSLGFAVLALLPLAGWWIMRPLVAEEETRIAAREQRIAAAVA
jgi:sugar phosphate permease